MSKTEKTPLENYMSCAKECSDETDYEKCILKCSRLYTYETECPMSRYHKFKEKVAKEYQNFFSN